MQHPLLAWNLRNNVRLNNARLFVVNHAAIALERQAKAVLRIQPDGYANAIRFLAGDDAAGLTADLTADQASPNSWLDEARQFREALRAEPSLLIVFGSEYRGSSIDALVEFGLVLPNASFACLGDYANSRGAADMGLMPDLLPGYVPVKNGGAFAEEYGSVMPKAPGMDLVEMFDAAGRGELAALYVVGSNPVARYGIGREVLKDTFIVVQEMFMTETASLADVVLPAANLYEKSGTVTNTYGDRQLVSKAGDLAGVRTDFEIIIRIGGKMGVNPKTLVPFGRGVRADMGQSRGAESGEADRHAVWLAAHNLEPKLSPSTPLPFWTRLSGWFPGTKAHASP